MQQQAAEPKLVFTMPNLVRFDIVSVCKTNTELPTMSYANNEILCLYTSMA